MSRPSSPTRIAPLAVALWLVPAAAQARPLTLKEAVREALARDPAVAAAALDVTAAEEKTGEAQTAWLPRLGLQGTYRYAGPVPTLNMSVATPFTPPGATEPLHIDIDKTLGINTYAAGDVTLGWLAFDFGARDARIDAARALTRAARAQGRERAAQIAYAVRAAYLGDRLFQDVIDVTQKSLATAQEALRIEKARLDAGLGSQVAMAGAQSRVAELESRLVEAQEQRARAAETLRLLLGWSKGETPEPSDTLEATVPASSAASGAATEPPNVAALRASASALGDQAEAIVRSYFPTLQLFGTAGYHYPRTFVETDAGWVWAFGASLNWDLFDGDLKRREHHEIQAKEAATEKLRQAAAEDAERARVDAETRLRAAASAIEATESQLEAAEVYLKAAQGAHQAGMGTDLDLRQAETAVDAAHLQVLQSRFQAAMAQASRLEAQGLTGTEREVQ